jgi:hypothetical protein
MPEELVEHSPLAPQTIHTAEAEVPVVLDVMEKTTAQLAHLEAQEFQTQYQDLP